MLEVTKKRMVHPQLPWEASQCGGRAERKAGPEASWRREQEPGLAM